MNWLEKQKAKIKAIKQAFIILLARYWGEPSAFDFKDASEVVRNYIEMAVENKNKKEGDR